MARLTPAADGIVRDFWFAETRPEQRFASDPAFDARIAARFGTLYEVLAAGVPEAWQATPTGVLAAVIVFDQFPRNLFRGQAKAFATDAAARALTVTALARGDDAGLSEVERQFLYMPLMHSEDAADQQRSVALFEALSDTDAADFARRHRDVVARFGRFPARNAALSRETTAEEAAFLVHGRGGVLAASASSYVAVMTTTLSEASERQIAQQVAAGKFSTGADVVDEALIALEWREQQREEERAWLEGKLSRAIDQLDRGEWIDAETFEARMRERFDLRRKVLA